jgi:hypothetical protein
MTKQQAILILTEHFSEGLVSTIVDAIVQDCANFVRETYDHEDAETIAWTMEVKYGLHKDY